MENSQFNYQVLLKVAPKKEDNDKRFIYVEASNESIDQSGDIVTQAALKESTDFFLKFGNCDLDHKSQLPQQSDKINSYMYEIGRPVAVEFNNDSTVAKCVIYSGNDAVASEMANYFWSSITEINPPKIWYASIGGDILERDISDRRLITKVRWYNLAFSHLPCNTNLSPVSISPIENLTKSLVDKLDKALEIGFETDASKIEGAQSLVRQSIDDKVKDFTSYNDLKEDLSYAILNNLIGQDYESLLTYLQSTYNLSDEDSVKHLSEFLTDLYKCTYKSK